MRAVRARIGRHGAFAESATARSELRGVPVTLQAASAFPFMHAWARRLPPDACLRSRMPLEPQAWRALARMMRL